MFYEVFTIDNDGTISITFDILFYFRNNITLS